MILNQEEKQKFNEYGYIIIDDFLPNDLYLQLLSDLNESQVKPVYQVKDHHYSHVFYSDVKTLPKQDEQYSAHFSLVSDHNKLNSLNTTFCDYLVPVMKSADSSINYALFPNAARLTQGHFYRACQEAYAGSIGYSYFVNDGWCWDYGGILTYVRSELESEMIYPKANRLLLRNEKFKHFHFLNTIEEWCTKSQYIVLGWASASKGEDSKIRGEYHAIT